MKLKHVLGDSFLTKSGRYFLRIIGCNKTKYLIIQYDNAYKTVTRPYLVHEIFFKGIESYEN